jgi:glycerol-3-phosphate O-acyltransferase
MARDSWPGNDAAEPGGRRFQPNPALRLLYRKFFDRIQVDENWVKNVREIAERGTVVYILRSLNYVDFLALDHLTRRFDLPEVRYVNDQHLGALSPTHGGIGRIIAPRSSKNEMEELSAAVQHGASAALFLKRPPNMLDFAAGASAGRGMREGDDHILTLIGLQRTRSRPILLVPQTFVWTNRPDTQGTQMLDVLLGPREWPSALRTVGQFLYNYRHVELMAGEPLDLARYLETTPGLSDEVHVRRVIYAMLRRLERERRTATGPAQKPPDRQRMQVLRSPKLQGAIAHMAGERKEDRNALNRRVLKMLREMQATPDSTTIKGLEMLLDSVFHRIYAGIDVDMEGLKRLKELTKHGSIVVLPSHKSHVDYLVLSFVFYQQNLQLPMIAAGDNLSFFPLGPVLRRAGGFFIRRSFKGDKLYSAAVEAYVRRLLRDGNMLELFLEGGRSRTGKLLEPKFGMLSMMVEAVLSLPSRKVFFVPVSIGYERIVESGSYEQEMSGGDKQKEDAAGLLRTTEVLRHRYGRIHVEFGRELTLDDVREDLGIPPGDEDQLTPNKRRSVVTRLANRAMDEINRVTAVTPGALTALALLSDRRRSIAHEELLMRCQKLLRVLITTGARITPRTALHGVLRPEAVREAAQMFVDAELIEVHDGGGELVSVERRELPIGEGARYRVPERKRIELDTSKNHIVHFFVERALVAVSVLHRPGMPVDVNIVRERVQSLSKLFKHEFRFRADAGFDEIFEETIAAMTSDGELRTTSAGRLDFGPGREDWPGDVWLRTYASILRNFLEGYRVAARGLGLLLKGPMTEKDLVRRTLSLGNRMFLSSDIELREAISKPLMQNALTSFREEGYVRVKDGRVALTSSFHSPEAVATIESRIAGFIDR